MKQFLAYLVESVEKLEFKKNFNQKLFRIVSNSINDLENFDVNYESC